MGGRSQYIHNKKIYNKIIPITCFVNGDIKLLPDKVFYGFLRPSDKFMKMIVFKHYYNKSIKIKKYDSNLETIKIQIENKNQNKQIVMKIVPINLKPGFLKGNITVEFEEPKEIVNIPIIGYVKSD